MTAAETVYLQIPELRPLLARADIYRLLSIAFSYPDRESLRELRGLLADLRRPDTGLGAALAPWLRGLEAALRGVDVRALQGEHTRLFAGQVECSAHETEYEFDPFAKARQLADIAGFYQAFGLQVAEERRGLPDFVAAELEFLSFLVLKEAYAAAQGWQQEREIAARAQRSFVEDHAGRWLPTFCANLAGSQAPFYAQLGAACLDFILAETDLLGARPLPLQDRAVRFEDKDAFKCGLAAAEDEGDEPFEGLPAPQMVTWLDEPPAPRARKAEEEG